jgi:hypothetical protein
MTNILILQNQQVKLLFVFRKKILNNAETTTIDFQLFHYPNKSIL